MQFEWAAAELAAEEGPIRDEIKKANIPQGLKPDHVVGFIRHD